MRDITLEDTFRAFFSTRQFADGVPTTLSGVPVLSVLEEDNAVPITAGVSISVDRAGVAGLNEVTIVATGANGFANSSSYAIYISTGTVGGVSVIGEIVGEFTIGLGAAAVDLANGTDGLGVIAGRLPAALVGGRIDSTVDATGMETGAVQNISRAVNPQANSAFADITWEMYDSLNHNPATGLTVTGERSLNGGAYEAITGTITEISDGTYQLDASAADMNGAMIVFRFLASGADDTFVHAKTAA